MIMNRRLLFLITLSAFLLSGCGGPSRDEIRDAVQSYDRIQLKKQLDALALKAPGVGTVAIKMSLPKPKDLTVTRLRTDRLTKDEHGNYTTTVSYTLQVGDEKQELVEKITLTHTKDGWQIISSEPL